ncbi:MAG: hypothetical protein HGB34_02165 [Candidatus Moranbacteria bacterium]|nr:hypothetical protein [Candidatus Moranbacteria bacterium]
MSKVKENETSAHKTALFKVFFFGICLALFPIWLTLLVSGLYGHFSFSDLARSGAFFVYSAALLSSANERLDGYFQYREVNLKRFVYQSTWILILLTAAGTLVSLIPSIFPPEVGAVIKQLENPYMVVNTSIISLLLAIVIDYYSYYKESYQSDPEKESRSQIDEMKEGLS